MEKTIDGFYEIDTKTVQKWLKDNQAIIIDVRENDEYNMEHINGAVLVPLSDFSVSKIPPLGGKKLVFQCKLGGRSTMACKKYLEKYPKADIWNMVGGITQWHNDGLPVVQG